ncbi:MAG: sensor histidine kinase, partial [Balneolales bacterium]|nr:sensor histidine kinase [Balneolales bacterium]
ISFSCNIEIDSISINHGIPLGIVFNELITNSIKYGFNGKENGLITIRAFSKNGINHIEYLDNGVGIANFDTTYAKGLGFTLINSLLSQIDATSVYATDNGFKLSFTFPARLNQA